MREKRKMKNAVKLLALACACVAASFGPVPSALAGSGAAAASSDLPPAAPLLRPGDKVAFLELGRVGCRPCEAMKPVMEAVRQKHGERVDVVFHDVKRDPAKAREYRIRLIPAQIFLKPDGQEFFRHEGYFPEDQVMAVLHRMGVR